MTVKDVAKRVAGATVMAPVQAVEHAAKAVGNAFSAAFHTVTFQFDKAADDVVDIGRHAVQAGINTGQTIATGAAVGALVVSGPIGWGALGVTASALYASEHIDQGLDRRALPKANPKRLA